MVLFPKVYLTSSLDAAIQGSRRSDHTARTITGGFESCRKWRPISNGEDVKAYQWRDTGLDGPGQITGDRGKLVCVDWDPRTYSRRLGGRVGVSGG